MARRPEGAPVSTPAVRSTLERLDSFDAVAERLAISVLKLASWVATIIVVLYGLWKAF